MTGPHHEPAAASSVPARYRGVWSRTLLRTPAGEDRSTWVRWLQAGSAHADLRVPPGAELAHRQGFCGRTTVQAEGADEVCTWHREHDLQPPAATPDAGRMVFESADRVVETGVHGDYLEVWERLPGSTGRSLVLAQGPARWLVAGRFAMRVRPRLAAWPADVQPGQTLAAVLQRHPAQAAALRDFEISFGALDGAQWTVERSTVDARVGRCLPWQLRRTGDGVALVDTGDGPQPWAVLEWHDGSEGPSAG